MNSSPGHCFRSCLQCAGVKFPNVDWRKHPANGWRYATPEYTLSMSNTCYAMGAGSKLYRGLHGQVLVPTVCGLAMDASSVLVRLLFGR